MRTKNKEEVELIINIIKENKGYIYTEDKLSKNQKCKLLLQSNNLYPKGDLSDTVIIPLKHEEEWVELDLKSKVSFILTVHSKNSGTIRERIVTNL